MPASDLERYALRCSRSAKGSQSILRGEAEYPLSRYHVIRPITFMSIILPSHSTPTSKSIKVDTAAGQPIDNAQFFDISTFEAGQMQELDRRYKKGLETRSGPTAKYNCHGMTFASRRTGIYETSEIQKILSDDQYSEIKPSDVLPGDVIIYYDHGDAEHSGIVLTSPQDSLLRVPRVLSKWGKASECIHWANHGPYNFGSVKYFRIIHPNEHTQSAKSL
jgi:hypothetical protein